MQTMSWSKCSSELNSRTSDTNSINSNAIASYTTLYSAAITGVHGTYLAHSFYYVSRAHCYKFECLCMSSYT